MSLKAKIILLSLVVVVGVVGTFIFSNRKQSSYIQAPKNTTTSQNAHTAIEHVFDKSDTETNTTSIHIVKPIITGLENKIVEKAINGQIDSIFKDMENSFVSETAGIKTFSDESKHQLVLTGSAPYVSTDTLFYIDIEIYSFYSGAAHPLTNRVVLNFVKETGQVVRIEDIFKKDSKNDSFTGALQALSKIAKPKVVEQLDRIIKDNTAEGEGIDAFFETGIEPIVDNYKVFYIHSDAIEWVFGQYQVAPYVFGEIKISIPFRDIQEYMAPRTYLR